jgi:hypothetical protein
MVPRAWVRFSGTSCCTDQSVDDDPTSLSRIGAGPVLGRYVLRVATWDLDAETTPPLDFRLVHNTFVTMFWRSSLLNAKRGL